MRRMFLLVAVVFGALAVGGCGGPKETIVVQTVVVTPTRVNLPAPTATWTPLPTVQPGQDWVEYRDIAGDFTTWYPAYWQIDGQAVDSVKFRLKDDAAVTLSYDHYAFYEAGTQVSVNDTVRIVMNSIKVEDEVEFMGSGTSYYSVDCDRVEYRTQGRSWNRWNHFVEFRCTQGIGEPEVTVQAYRLDGVLSEAEINQIGYVAGTVRRGVQ